MMVITETKLHNAYTVSRYGMKMVWRMREI